MKWYMSQRRRSIYISVPLIEMKRNICFIVHQTDSRVWWTIKYICFLVKKMNNAF